MGGLGGEGLRIHFFALRNIRKRVKNLLFIFALYKLLHEIA